MGAELSIATSPQDNRSSSFQQSDSAASALEVPQPLLTTRTASPIESKNEKSSNAHFSSVDVSSFQEYLSVETFQRLRGGTDDARRAESALERQSKLRKSIEQLNLASLALRNRIRAQEGTSERLVGALNRMQRLSLSLGDLQDHLERSIATANILGASHLAESGQLGSFRCFCDNIQKQS